MIPEQFYNRRNLVIKSGIKQYPIKPSPFAVREYPYILQPGENLYTVGQRIFGDTPELWTLLIDLNPSKRLDEWNSGDTIILPEIITVDAPNSFIEKPEAARPKFVYERPEFLPVVVAACAIPLVVISEVGSTYIKFNLSTATGELQYWFYQYRVDGGAWSGDILSFAPDVTLGGLAAGQNVDVRAMSNCTYGATSVYSNFAGATTLIAPACLVPTIEVFDVQDTSFKINVGPDNPETVSQVIEYRMLGAVDWIKRVVPSGVTRIMNLIPEGIYEVRAARNCNDDIVSGYTAIQEVQLFGACEMIKNLQYTANETSVTYTWAAGFGNRRWKVTLNGVNVTYSKTVWVTEPTVTFSELVAGEYKVDIIPDCTVCEPEEPETLVLGNPASVEEVNSFGGAILHLDNEWSINGAVVMAGAHAINATYEQKVLNIVPVKTDFDYMLENEFNSLKLQSDAATEQLIIPVDLFTVYNGAQRDLRKVDAMVSDRFTPDNPATWMGGSITHANAVKIPAVNKIVGTVSSAGVTTVPPVPFSLLFNVRFIDLTPNASQVEFVPDPNVFNSGLTIFNWTNAYKIRVLDYLNAVAEVTPEAIMLKGLMPFLKDGTETVRNAVITMVKELSVAIKLIFPGIPVIYFAENDEHTAKFMGSYAREMFVLDELFAMTEIDRVMISGVTEIVDFINKSHFVSISGSLAVAKPSAVVDGNVALVPLLSPRIFSGITGSRRIIHSGVTFNGSGYIGALPPLGSVAFSTAALDDTGSAYLTTKNPSGIAHEIHFKFSFKTFTKVGTIINAMSYPQIMYSGNDLIADFGGTIFNFGNLAVDTIHSIEFHAVRTALGEYTVSGSANGVAIAGASVNTGADLVVYNEGVMRLGAEFEGFSEQPTRFYDLYLSLKQDDGLWCGAHYLFLDHVYGVRTEWEAAKNANKELISVLGANTVGSRDKVAVTTQTTIAPSPLPADSNIRAYFDKLAQFRIFLREIRTVDAVHTKADEPAQLALINADTLTVEPVADYIFIHKLDARYYKALKGVYNDAGVQKLWYNDAPNYLLDNTINGKSVLGYTGTIQDKLIP